MAVSSGFIYIYSNDGSTLLEEFLPAAAYSNTVTITAEGVEMKADSDRVQNAGTYAYEGDKAFIGLATTKGATEPTYPIGSTFTFPAYGSDVTYYIVEGEKEPKVTITYNENVIASLGAGQTATLQCNGKKMTSDIIVTAPEVAEPEITDSPLPIEITSADEMTALLSTAEVGSVYKYTGETTDTYENGALYVVGEETSGVKTFRKLLTELTDLTGTTWDFRRDWTATAGYGFFVVDGTLLNSGNTFNFDRFAIGGYYGSTSVNTTITNANRVGIGKSPSWSNYFNNSSSFTVTFTGGADVTNADLISWVKQNGIQQ